MEIAAYELRDRFPNGEIPNGAIVLYQSEPRTRKIRVIGWEDAPDPAYITLIIDDPTLSRRMVLQRKEVEVVR
jgi:hypothetical protein